MSDTVRFSMRRCADCVKLVFDPIMQGFTEYVRNECSTCNQQRWIWVTYEDGEGVQV